MGLLEQPKSRTLTPRAGEEVERQEPAFPDGESTEQRSHLGNECGCFLQN